MAKIDKGALLARKLLDSYGGEVDDFFKLWPPDKTYFFSRDGQAFIAYGKKLKVAVCLGDPVGKRSSIEGLLREFKTFTTKEKLTITFIQSTDKYAKEYRSVGLRGMLIGADAVVNLEHFFATTLHNKYFRNLVNRYDKGGFSFHSYEPPHPVKLLSELRELSANWSTLPHRKEWSFLTGRFDNDYLQYVPLFVLRDKDGKAQAFANGLPTFKPGVMTIDLMRHKIDAPPNAMDLLFINLIKAKANQKYSYFNLGMSPLDARHFSQRLSERLLIRLYKLGNSFIGFRGLHQFKAKYQPEWEPRYIFYQPGLGHLTRSGLAVFKLLQGQD